MCPSPPANGITTSWPDCSVGLDPSANGGDLLWAEAVYLPGGPYPYYSSSILFALGPTGDIVLGTEQWSSPDDFTFNANRFNGSGYGISGGSSITVVSPGNPSFSLLVSGHNDLITYTWWDDYGWYEHVSGPGVSWQRPYSGTSGDCATFMSWTGDRIGNVFALVKGGNTPTSFDAAIQIPGPGTYLLRGGVSGESVQPNFSGSFVPDQTGGVYRFGALGASLDLGCGAMVPTSPSSTYLARLDASWSCVFSRVLPTGVSVLADAGGGAILSATSTTPLDLGCGALPAAPGGSTFLTRLDAAGGCVFARSLPVPNLGVRLDGSGRVVLSGFAGSTPVDLGGGPLPPLGSQDLVLAELDASGAHLWSRRFGAPGVTFTSPKVSTSQAGDVYLQTGWSGAVDLGGGPITAASGDIVIGSFSPTGAHRWSRGFHFPGGYQAGIDGCGALVVASTDNAFDPGCGKLLPVTCTMPACMFNPANTIVARFAP